MLSLNTTVLYICNREQSCKNSPICGIHCNHTHKKEFKQNDENTYWALKRIGDMVFMVEGYPAEEK